MKVTNKDLKILNEKVTEINKELYSETKDKIFLESAKKIDNCQNKVYNKSLKKQVKHYCNDTFCFICNRRKANEIQKKVEYILSNFDKEKGQKGRKLIHFVLTKNKKSVNKNNIEQKVEEMKKEVFKFYEDIKKLDHKINAIIKQEIKVKNKQFNIHFHIILNIKKRFAKKNIANLWKKGKVIFGKNKADNNWSIKTMSYYIAKQKVNYRNFTNNKSNNNIKNNKESQEFDIDIDIEENQSFEESFEDLKFEIKHLTKYYKNNKNNKNKGRQTLFIKGDLFKKLAKQYKQKQEIEKIEYRENEEIKQLKFKIENLEKNIEEKEQELKEKNETINIFIDNIEIREKDIDFLEEENKILFKELREKEEEIKKINSTKNFEIEELKKKANYFEADSRAKETTIKLKIALIEAMKRKEKEAEKEREKEREYFNISINKEQVKVKEKIAKSDKLNKDIYLYFNKKNDKCYYQKDNFDKSIFADFIEIDLKNNYEEFAKTYHLQE